METTINNTLRLHRKQKGLSQQQVSEHLGFKSKDRISKWENGLKLPNAVNLLRLAKLYEVNAEMLYPDFS